MNGEAALEENSGNHGKVGLFTASERVTPESLWRRCWAMVKPHMLQCAVHSDSAQQRTRGDNETTEEKDVVGEKSF